ncbi:energy-coupling factor transporter transmembrane component T [Enterococcus sp. 2201sp1_2201st1_B8_2201SCRN_220225]|uniref:energy-coupling factor transporter transmembrane component T n=1 Tax=unclassified Enterococcus TaxID=2608891 RepID=UPI0034A5768D
MESLSQRITELNPLTKLMAVFVLGIITLVFPKPWLGFAILLFLLIISVVTHLFRPFSKLVFGFGIPLTIMLVFIQGVYSPKNTKSLMDLGIVEIGVEGTQYALNLVATLLVFMGAFFLMNQTTKTAKLVAALTASGLNPKAGYLVLASLNVVPQMNRRMKTIKEAQESRGVETGGNVIQRVRSFIPLIGPVVLSSFTDAQERGMTLETRGFGIKGVSPTSLTRVNTTKIDLVVRGLLLVLLISVLSISMFERLSVH